MSLLCLSSIIYKLIYLGGCIKECPVTLEPIAQDDGVLVKVIRNNHIIFFMVNNIITLRRLKSCPLSVDINDRYFYLLLRQVSEETFTFVTESASQKEMKSIFEKNENFKLGFFNQKKERKSEVNISQLLDYCIEEMERQRYYAELNTLLFVMPFYILSIIIYLSNTVSLSLCNSSFNHSGHCFFSSTKVDASDFFYFNSSCK